MDEEIIRELLDTKDFNKVVDINVNIETDKNVKVKI